MSNFDLLKEYIVELPSSNDEVQDNPPQNSSVKDERSIYFKGKKVAQSIEELFRKIVIGTDK